MKRVVLLVSLAIYVAMWTQHRFTCVDALRMFAGAPYPSFLWPLLAKSENVAQGLGVGFGIGCVVITWMLAQRVVDRPIGVALILLAVVTNRTFVTWTSSGLETSLFIFLVLAWVLASQTVHAGWIAALLVLTRPDGAFFALATLVLLRKKPLALLPLVLPVIAFVVRRPPPSFWTETGARNEVGPLYLMSFVLEYALFGWLALVLLCALKIPRADRSKLLRDPRMPVVLALLLHFAYYTFRSGGDPLEYRVYAHLIPLLWISFFSLAAHAGFSLEARVRSFAAVLALASIIPWIGGSFPIYGTAWATTQRSLKGHGKCQRLADMAKAGRVSSERTTRS